MVGWIFNNITFNRAELRIRPPLKEIESDLVRGHKFEVDAAVMAEQHFHVERRDQNLNIVLTKLPQPSEFRRADSSVNF